MYNFRSNLYIATARSYGRTCYLFPNHEEEAKRVIWSLRKLQAPASFAKGYAQGPTAFIVCLDTRFGRVLANTAQRMIRQRAKAAINIMEWYTARRDIRRKERDLAKFGLVSRACSGFYGTSPEDVLTEIGKFM